MFVDKAKINVRAGDGGNGIVNFRHEKFIDRGGPDGGDGGKGGDIIFTASRNQNTLATFRFQKELVADSGKPGGKQRKHGRSGKDRTIQVPVGTIITDQEEVVLADLKTDGQEIIIAAGGKGGFGNAHFVSSRRQTPRMAEKGEPGQFRELTLELKSIADVGLIGLPNAGKSTLLAATSNARPEIADYPFTTLIPNLGVVVVDNKTSLLLADVPGLIEGASEGKGLGDDFLRHIERTSVLVHVIDVYQDVAASFKTIQKELNDYTINLTKKPQVIALNKVEGMNKAELAKKMTAIKKVIPKGTKVFAISAASKEGIQELLFELKSMVIKERTKVIKKEASSSIPVITLPESDDAWQIEQVDNRFVVTGIKIERFAQRTDFDNGEAVERLRDILRKRGVMHELERKKIRPGQKISIAGHSIEY